MVLTNFVQVWSICLLVLSLLGASGVALAIKTRNELWHTLTIIGFVSLFCVFVSGVAEDYRSVVLSEKPKSVHVEYNCIIVESGLNTQIFTDTKYLPAVDRPENLELIQYYNAFGKETHRKWNFKKSEENR